MQRYFVEATYQPTVNLTGEAYHHIVHVMRMKSPEKIFVVFSDGISVVAEIVEITENQVLAKELYKEEQAKELPIDITIASGYPKGDKLEWIVQKGTELGAAQFIGFPAKASVVKWDEKKIVKKQQRLTKIAQEAAEQAQRQIVPEIHLFSKAEDIFKRLADYDLILVAYEESAKMGEQSHLVQAFQQAVAGQKVLAIFGPEGGLAPAEIEKFTAAGGILCGLGPRILRTETAPLYLLSAASFYFELKGE
ncbi:16S rRNA (uracil(1498)-N(3))-methyltransferase [Enterococcus sp. LJL120]